MLTRALLAAVGLIASSSVVALDIVRDGKAMAVVVTPDNADEIVRDGAACLVSYVEKATGVRLDIVPESRAPTPNAIALGATKLAAAEGIDPATIRDDGYVHKVRGNRFFIVGPDLDLRPRHKTLNNVHYRRHRAWGEPHQVRRGTLNGVVWFLHDYCGVRWFIPTPMGEHVPATRNISVPDGLDTKEEPPFQAALHNVGYSETINGSRWAYVPGGSYWMVANSYRWPINYLHLGGHSWDTQVSLVDANFERLFKKQPELFYERDGKRRWSSKNNMLCTSNPATVRMLTQTMGRLLGLGWDLVQYNQSDGYRRCTCQQCEAMDRYRSYGRATDDPCYRLLLPAKQMAEALHKTHAGKKILMMAYGPTATPPKSFKTFPPNVCLQIAGERPETFAAWKGIAPVYSVWLYWFGCYQVPGVTVKQTPRTVAEKIRFLHSQGVKALYWGWCSAGENWGNAGPVYYALGQLLRDPTQAYEPFLEEYYEGVYGKAKPAVNAYFDLLYQTLETRYFGQRESIKNASDFFAMVYTPDVLRQLEAHLKHARKLVEAERHTRWLDLTVDQFTYLKLTATAVHEYRAFERRKNLDSIMRVKQAVDARRAYIRRLKRLGQDKDFVRKWYPGYRGIVRYIDRNGRLQNSGRLDAPFSWSFDDPEKLLMDSWTAVVNAAAEPITLDGQLDEPAWRSAVRWDIDEINAGKLDFTTTMQLLHNERGLLLGFECAEPLIENMKIRKMERDARVWRQECIELFFDVEKKAQRFMHFALNPVAGNFYDARQGYIADPIDPLFKSEDPSWNPDWTYGCRIDKQKRRWVLEVMMPYTALGIAQPKLGDSIRANFGRERRVGKTGKDVDLSLWSPNFKSRGFADPDGYGLLRFGNLVSDPGLEAPESGGDARWKISGHAHVDGDVVHSGKRAVRFDISLDDSTDGRAVLSIPMALVKGGSQVRCSVWANLPKGIEQGKGSASKIGLELMMRSFGKAGHIADEKIVRHTRTNGWIELHQMLRLPAEANRLRLLLRMKGQGKAYLDDVSIVPVE